jgi:hypothetical protein
MSKHLFLKQGLLAGKEFPNFLNKDKFDFTKAVIQTVKKTGTPIEDPCCPLTTFKAVRFNTVTSKLEYQSNSTTNTWIVVPTSALV